jgi:hypothetical protein
MNEAPALTFASAIVFAAIAACVALASRRFAWAGPASIALAAPFAWYHEFGPTEMTVPKAAFLGAALGIAAALWSDADLRRRAALRLGGERSLAFLALFAVLSGLSAFWAREPADAIRDALKWAWYAGAFALAVACIETSADAAKVALCAIAAAAAVGAVGLAQHLTSAPSSFVAENGAVIGRLAGTLEGPNQFGAYLDTIIPVLLAVLLLARMHFAAVAAGALLLGGLCAELLLAYSRGALWSCVAAVLLVVCFWAWARARGQMPDLRRAALVAVLAAAVFLPIAGSAIGAAGWQHEFWSAGLRDTSDSTALRRSLWNCAAMLYERHPIAGVGAANFGDADSGCAPSEHGGDHLNANNWYLETAADLGTIGLLVLGLFIAAQLATARRLAALSDPVALGAFAAFAAFLLHGLVDDVMPYPKAALTLFVFLGTIRNARKDD